MTAATPFHPQASTAAAEHAVAHMADVLTFDAIDVPEPTEAILRSLENMLGNLASINRRLASMYTTTNGGDPDLNGLDTATAQALNEVTAHCESAAERLSAAADSEQQITRIFDTRS